MTFAGINYLAILIAAIAGLARGRASGTACSATAGSRRKASTMEEFKAQQAAMVGKLAGQLPFIARVRRQSRDGLGAGRHGRASWAP